MSNSADYRAWVEVLPEFRQFNQQVQAGVVGGLAGAGSSGAAAMGGGLIAGVKKFALPLVGAFAALGIGSAISNSVQSGIDAGINYVKSAVGAGSDYNESLNAVSVAYGDFAAEINRLAQSSAQDLGLSRVDFNSIAVQFSAFAKTIQSENPAGFIADLSTRGSDFASVFNIDVSEALRLFQSGLAGQTEPLRRYGIDLSAATVQAFAYANGIAEQGTQLTETQRQQAAYGALMEQTAMVAGDFSNTSDQLANAQRILNAEFEDTKAELGMQLLPVLQDVLRFVSSELMPIWKDFNAELGPILRESLEEAWPTIRELAVRILPLIPPAIKLVIDSIKWFIETIDGNMRFINVWTGLLEDVFRLLRGDISVNRFVANFQERLASWREAVDRRVQDVQNTFRNFGRTVVQTVTAIGGNIYNAGRALIQRLIDGIRSMLQPAGDAVAGVMSYVRGFFPSSPAERGPFSGAGWAKLAQSGAAVLDQFSSGFKPVDVPLSLSPLDGSQLDVNGSLFGSVGARSSAEVNINVSNWDPATVADLVQQSMNARLAVA